MTPSTYTPRSPSLPCDVGGCHSSTRPPHRAGGSKAKLARARIGDIDHADIIALHRLADLVPAYPHFLQLRGIADGAHLLFDVVARDRLAVQRALALAIGGLEAGGDCVAFGRSTRRRRRWPDDALSSEELRVGEEWVRPCKFRW